MLSQKQLNFGRFSIVCVDVIKHPLKDILTIFIKPADLDQEIQNCKPLLKGENKLNPDQRKKCCYKSPNSPDYSKFDITLLYKLIRNLCPSLEPKKKWGSKPTSNDMDVGDDIERIRKLRNTYFAHIELAEISDDEFRDLWSDVKCVIQRCQQYTSSKGCTTDYNKMLIDLERKTFTSDEYTFMKKRSGAIYVYGEPDIFCGKTACFEAEITLEDDVFLPVSWDRVKGMLRKQLDVEDEKYRGSDNRQLLIHNVCKDDEAGYQAVLSRNDDVKILSNKVYLRPKGDRPCLDDLNATSKEGKIYIHYVCKVSENFPLKSIKWTKNKSELEVPCNKYRGGGVADNCVEILMPDEDDKGLYTCTVLNAVGPDSKKVKLDKPSADIVSTSNSKVVCGSDTTFDCTVSGYPSPDVVKWQHSLDGTEFFDINTDTDIYLRSSSGLSSHSLLVRKAKLNEQRYYRVVVSNSIGKCNSNKLFLQVTGSKPNISEVTCSLHGNSVKLKCDVFLYDESPPLNSVYWTKGGKHIVIATNDRKYAGADKNGPSLTIYNVNCDDAGEYQLIAVNPVGETWSKVILLGVPEVLLKECIKTEDGSLWFTMAIKSVPVPHSVKWNIKEKNTDTFEPINVNAAEYIGTSNTFPHPVLVIKHKEKLDNCIFEIEVKNRIGKEKRMISGFLGNILQEELKRKKKTLGTFYDDGGSGIPFSIWLSGLAEKFPKEKNDTLKFLIQSSCKIEDVTELEKAKTAQDCFKILLKEKIISPSDVIAMQFLLIKTKCEELEKECIDYAKQQKAMHFYEKPPDPGPYVHRLAGFSIYVSNTTSRLDGQLCYKDETGGTPSVNQIISCSIVGRYVIYYNERSRNHNPFYLSQYAYNELCEIEVYGCRGSYGEGCLHPCPTHCFNCDTYTGDCLSCLPGYQGQSCKNECKIGHYGRNCSYKCSNNCYVTSVCNITTGKCEGGCKPGWTGDTCDQVCKSGFYGENCKHKCSQNCNVTKNCDRFTGYCDGGCEPGWKGRKCDQIEACESGYYGKSCSNHCSMNCKVTNHCDRFTGQCYEGCKPGWTGLTCRLMCASGYYGHNCSNKCSQNCNLTNSCDRITGECNGGCKSGWTGITCRQMCQLGHYGHNCSYECSPNCKVTNKCDRFTGQCDVGCKPGWTGNTCDQQCMAGYYGKDCLKQCSTSCASSCNRISGHCDHGCKPGWAGNACDKKVCDNGYFGAECNRKCGHCLQADHCHHINGSCLNGCLHGYKGEYCNETCPPGFFGLDCINRCDSFCSGNESCDPVLGICNKGCKRGWTGLMCGLDRLNRQSNADNMPIVIGVVVSVLIIVGGSIIHVILWRRKISTTLQVPSDGPSETSQQYTELAIINKPSNYDEIHSYSNQSNL